MFNTSYQNYLFSPYFSLYIRNQEKNATFEHKKHLDMENLQS
jgi:hypothetical protein